MLIESLSPLRERFIEPFDFVLSALALGNVIVRLEDRNGLLATIKLQRPSARHDHRGSIGLYAPDFAFPPPGLQ